MHEDFIMPSRGVVIFSQPTQMVAMLKVESDCAMQSFK